MIVPLLALGATIAALRDQGPAEVRLAGYATTLDGRTPNQRYNTLEAMRALDGERIGPGETFSFNGAVGTWSTDMGYKKAPVSYNGQLVWAVGGGVCQTSTTLYNAGLLAGLEVVERHRHHFAPGYVPPGRDAAVAYDTIDLKLRNPYPWPVRIAATQRGHNVVVELFGAKPPSSTYTVDTELHEVRAADMLRGGPATAQARLIHPGKPGVKVTTWRVIADDTGMRRELLSEDDYPSMPRVVVYE